MTRVRADCIKGTDPSCRTAWKVGSWVTGTVASLFTMRSLSISFRPKQTISADLNRGAFALFLPTSVATDPTNLENVLPCCLPCGPSWKTCTWLYWLINLPCTHCPPLSTRPAQLSSGSSPFMKALGFSCIYLAFPTYFSQIFASNLSKKTNDRSDNRFDNRICRYQGVNSASPTVTLDCIFTGIFRTQQCLFQASSWPLPPLSTESVVRVQQSASFLMLVLCLVLAASVLTASFAVHLVRFENCY